MKNKEFFKAALFIVGDRDFYKQLAVVPTVNFRHSYRSPAVIGPPIINH